MKRITSLALAFVLLLGTLSAGVYTVSAASDMRASDECIRVLKEEEGFVKYPMWDYAQWTVGYGTRCPDDMLETYRKDGISENAAETLLRNFLIGIESELNSKIVDKYGLKLSQNQFDALVSFSYNCGTQWVHEMNGTFHSAIRDGATGNDLVRAFALWCSAGGEIKDFLLRRRLSEANMYLNAVYDKNPPENYCYVTYDANGGTSSPRSQGYDSDLTAKPYPVPTYSGHTFAGWYTARSGGKKISKLDTSTKGKTLYAHWKDGEGNTPSEGEPEVVSVKIKVTGDYVNLREGAGTNYRAVGQAREGDELTVTETAFGTGYKWGKTEKGWIALTYTDYEYQMSQQSKPEEPETTAPETKPEKPKPEKPTDPEKPKPEKPTDPEKPKPEKPKPEKPKPEKPTDPEKPKPVKPPKPEKPQKPKVTGRINVNEWLRVRSGPGTGYEVAGYLGPQDKVEILEQKTVGSMVWGKISNGWISMDYVILDKPASSGEDQPAGAKNGTIVNCNQLRIRSGPSTGYSIVGYLNAGEKVSITEKTTTGSMVWGKISNGWISLDYVSLDTDSSGSSSNTDKVITGIINVQEWLRIRTGPGTSYAVAGYYGPNDKVEITEQRSSGAVAWGKTSKGWISMDYVTVTSSGTQKPAEKPETDKKPDTRTVIGDCLRVRKDAGTENTIVGYLYYGAKVEILETKPDSQGTIWGRISNGWISLDYAK